MRDEFDWRYSLEKDFNFQGGLSPRIETIYEERSKEWPACYGTAPNRQVSSVTNVCHIDLTVLDEDVLVQHQKKCMVVCGGWLAFRGHGEHAYLTVAMIKDGVFESGHLLEGKPYIEVDNMIDKSHKLGLNRTVKRKTNNLM